MSAKVKFAELQIIPDRTTQFGDLSNGKIISKNVTIENVGHFATNFAIESLKTVLERKMTLGCYSQFDQHYSEL